MTQANVEKAKLYVVTGPIDNISADTSGDLALTVQFNPVTLKVGLANSLKENERDNQSRASQFIEKSSSNLTVELIFDTTDAYTHANPNFTPDPNSTEPQGPPQLDMQKIDVRQQVKKIATSFMQSADVGNEDATPKRCLFAWGTFAFVGIMESMEETLDFFSPDGVPLRATVSIKLSESRFQYVNKNAEAAARDTPQLSGASSVSDASNGSNTTSNNDSDQGSKKPDPKKWRDIAMFNGLESPKLPTPDGLAIPSAGASASLKAQASASIGAGIKGGFGAGLGAGFSAGGGLSLGLSASAGISAGAGISGGLGASLGAGAGISGGISGGIGGDLSAGISGGASADIASALGGGLSASANIKPPAFNFGASASLGTNIPGAFSADLNKGGGLSAGGLLSGGTSLRGGSSSSVSHSLSNQSGTASASASASSNGLSASAQASASVGFD